MWANNAQDFVIHNGVLVKYLGNDEKVVVPNGVHTIKEFAFSKEFPYNLATKAITLPEDVYVIEAGAFYNCAGLSRVKIPGTVSEIGNGAFGGCSNLLSITVQSGNRFYHSKGKCLIDTQNKTIIAGCKNVNIPIDGSVERIGPEAFAKCDMIMSMHIPACITDINETAFLGAFVACITIDEQNPVYHMGGDCIIETATKTLVAGDECGVIPDDGSVTSIGPYAFAMRKQIKNIAIPRTITHIDQTAFSGCPSVRFCTPIGSAAENFAKSNNIPFTVA